MRTMVVAVLVAAASAALHAKGPTVKLTLSGPGLGTPVEISDPAVLALSHVWEGRFLGTALAGPPRVKGPVYTVSFDVRLTDAKGTRVERAYTARVARDARLGTLLLFLPGRGDDGYALNARSIVRDGHDGRWHRPLAAWAAAIEPHLP